jgi:hypothetical protein
LGGGQCLQEGLILADLVRYLTFFSKLWKLGLLFLKKVRFSPKSPKKSDFYFFPNKKCFIIFLVIALSITVVIWSTFLFWFHGVHVQSYLLFYKSNSEVNQSPSVSFSPPEVPLCQFLSQQWSIVFLSGTSPSVLVLLLCLRWVAMFCSVTHLVQYSSNVQTFIQNAYCVSNSMWRD